MVGACYVSEFPKLGIKVEMAWFSVFGWGYRRRDSYKEGQNGSRVTRTIRSLLPTDHPLCPSDDCINWFRIRGWDSESGHFLLVGTRYRIAGVLNYDALSNLVPVENTIPHDGYCLLDVNEWGRWESSCFQ